MALAERSPCRTAPLCNRAHKGSDLRNKYAIRPIAVLSAIDLSRLQVLPNSRKSSPGRYEQSPHNISGGSENKLDSPILPQPTLNVLISMSTNFTKHLRQHFIYTFCFIYEFDELKE